MSVRKMYIRYREDSPETELHAVAERGFRERGVETAPYYWIDDIDDERRMPDLGHDVGVAGYIGDVWKALDRLGVPRPPSLDYPEELRSFLGRSLERMPLSEARTINSRKMFVKPVKQKLFTGFVCEGTFNDQIRMGPYSEDEVCWISDPVKFVSEYRCFVLRGDILSARHYKGDWGVAIDRKVVEAAVQAWESAPCAYTLDFGATDDGRTLLVEVNDGFAMGTYGLMPVLYAQMLEARWQEMVPPGAVVADPKPPPKPEPKKLPSESEVLQAAKAAVVQAKAELGLGHYKRLPKAKSEALEDRALEILIERLR